MRTDLRLRLEGEVDLITGAGSGAGLDKGTEPVPENVAKYEKYYDVYLKCFDDMANGVSSPAIQSVQLGQ
jgi:hypothetical protein